MNAAMLAPDLSAAAPRTTLSARPPASIFLPKEHGSWALALEPLALGLLVAPSLPGGALALATVAGFFARRPLKTLLAPGARPAGRIAEARVALAIWAGAAALGFGETVALAGFAGLWPLALVAPLAALFVYFDRQNAGRAAVAELAGSTAFALLPAALATLAGWRAPAALALAALMLARSVPTILSVRASLRRAKGEAVSATVPLASAGLALLAVGALIAFGWVPRLTVICVILLLIRTLWFVSPLRPSWSARRIGMAEAVLGVVCVTLAALSYHHP
ncbi:MAG: YwiC-like family protein [Verrucomicrobia bacterium]|nr:YwiC-like family protein [Verrucomicrobiota bacterium]